MSKSYPQPPPDVKDICWMVANEYYEILSAKKKGKVLRVEAYKARERFLEAMAKLRDHA